MHIQPNHSQRSTSKAATMLLHLFVRPHQSNRAGKNLVVWDLKILVVAEAVVIIVLVVANIYMGPLALINFNSKIA